MQYHCHLLIKEVPSTYLSADSRDEMELWVEKLQSATGQPPSEHSQAESNNDNQNGNCFMYLKNK